MSQASDREQLGALADRLEVSQWVPEAERRARQLEAATLVLRHAVATVPYYAALRDALPAADRALSADEWRRLPLLPRIDLQQRAASLLSTRIPPQHLPTVEVQTSGSTGSPLTMTVTEATQLMWHALTERELRWNVDDFRGGYAAIRTSHRKDADYPEGALFPDWGWPTNLLRSTGPGALLAVQTGIDEQLEWLQRIAPAYLLTYPSNALDLGATLERRGLRLPSLRHLRLIGEAIDAEQLDLLARQFGVPVRDTYSANEVGYLASQCREHGRYHVHAESVLLEVIGDDGRACAPGEVGRVVVTTLHNFAMPLIRYAIGDYAEVGSPCPCGRGLPVLRRVLGRSRNMLTVPGAGRQWAYFGVRYWRDIAPVLQCQILQHEPDRLEVKLVVERPLDDGELQRLREVLHREARYPFRVDFSFHDKLERSAGGKFEEFKSLLE